MCFELCCFLVVPDTQYVASCDIALCYPLMSIIHCNANDTDMHVLQEKLGHQAYAMLNKHGVCLFSMAYAYSALLDAPAPPARHACLCHLRQYMWVRPHTSTTLTLVRSNVCSSNPTMLTALDCGYSPNEAATHFKSGSFLVLSAQ